MLKQFFVFSGVGAIGTLSHFMALIILVQFVQSDKLLASNIGCLMGAATNYVLNYHITFKSDKKHIEAAPKFFSIAGVGLLLNITIMSWLLEGADSHYLVSQLMATGCVLAWGFMANRLWTFR